MQQVSLWPLRVLLRSRSSFSSHGGGRGPGSTGATSGVVVGKYGGPDVDVALSTGLSYFVFFGGHGAVVAVRHSFDLAGAAEAMAAAAGGGLEAGTPSAVAMTDYHSKVIRVRTRRCSRKDTCSYEINDI